jgi:cytochrome P450
MSTELAQSASVHFPPGPKGHPFLGVMRKYNRDGLAFVERCARDYGDVVRTRFLYVTAYFIFDPGLIEQVLVTDNRNYIKSASLRSPFFQRMVGNGLVTSEGDFWRRQRRLAQPAFHRNRLESYGRIMVELTEGMLSNWSNGQSLDVHQEMMRLTQEIVVKCLFSTEVSGDTERIMQALDIIVKPFASQATLRWILDNRLPTPGNRRFHKAVRKLDEIIYRIIEERRASGQDRGDLLSMLLQARDEDGGQMSDKQLRDEVMTIFLAGHETTALALSWAWYLLSRHPEIEAKLGDELEESLGERAPSLGDLPRLRYAENVIKESLRLYPPAYAVGREAIRDCEVGGYSVPKGTQLFIFQWVVQRDPRFFPSPEEFDPDRWTEEFTAGLPKYAYFPFGGGPRACIGNSFAMMEATLLLATIAQKFRLRLTPPNREVGILPALSLRPKGGIKVEVLDRVRL